MIMADGHCYSITKQGFKQTELLYVPERERMQSAVSVAHVALKNYREDRYCSDTELGVNYLRPSQAERERAERLKSEENKDDR
jgi:hypothetical protein